MLTRQRTVLDLLVSAGRPLSPTVFVKLVFLLRHETPVQRTPAFYDFVPYKFGPFSFSLYRDLAGLRHDGYVAPEGDRVTLSPRMLGDIGENSKQLAPSVRAAVAEIIGRYGTIAQEQLIRSVYSRYPWFATRSELAEVQSLELPPRPAPPLAVYTAGYENKSVDLFLNDLLRKGIEVLIDVRANPLSRKYGFSRRQLADLAGKLGVEYVHFPDLGIPSKDRADLDGFDSYQRLFQRYEEEMLPKNEGAIQEVARLMRLRPSVLVCFEGDVRCCHRSRLASAVSRQGSLEITHL